MRIACCIPKATDAHSEYVILITFLLQQWLQERASMLGYTYIASLFFLSVTNDNDTRNIITTACMLLKKRDASDCSRFRNTPATTLQSNVIKMRKCVHH
jgi:hypothetical protein